MTYSTAERQLRDLYIYGDRMTLAEFEKYLDRLLGLRNPGPLGFSYPEYGALLRRRDNIRRLGTPFPAAALVKVRT